MASFFLTEMVLLKENHLSCSHYPALLTNLEHTKQRLCEEHCTRYRQAVASVANSKHDWYLQQLYFPKLRQRAGPFLACMYSRLHVQLLGGF